MPLPEATRRGWWAGPLALAVIVFCALVGPSSCAAYEVAVVVGGEGSLYRDALDALRRDLTEARLTIVDVARSTPTRRQVERLAEYPFDAIVAVGGRAIGVARAIQGRRPLVCCMTLVGSGTVGASPGGGGPVLVVPYLVGLGRQITTARERFGLPALRVGVVWSDPTLQDVVDEARRAAASVGATVVARRADGPAAVPGALRGLVGEIDVFWLLPDRSLLDPDALRHLMLFLLENEKPVMACSDALVSRGALFALTQEPSEVGRRVGIAVRAWFTRRELVLPPEEPGFLANDRVGRALGLIRPTPGQEEPGFEGVEAASPQPTATAP